MKLSVLAAVTTILLSGCGLAETTTVAASQAAASAEEAKKGKEMEDKIQRDIEAAQKKEREVRDKAEAASE